MRCENVVATLSGHRHPNEATNKDIQSRLRIHRGGKRESRAGETVRNPQRKWPKKREKGFKLWDRWGEERLNWASIEDTRKYLLLRKEIPDLRSKNFQGSETSANDNYS